MTEPAADLLHQSYRDLISARLCDGLDAKSTAYLGAHLEACARCRQFEHDLVEHRHLLQALPPLIPPRDLWARTSAALDRELLRDARNGDPKAAPRASGGLGELANPRSVPSVLMVSLASVGLAVTLLMTQLGPTLRLPIAAVPGQPTPFAGAGVALAFVGADSSGLTLYRTRIDQACPPTSQCDEEEAIAARVTFPANFQPNNLALTPRGDRLAIMGSDNERENVFAVLVVPAVEDTTGSDFPDRPRSPDPTSTPVVASAGPGASVVFVGRTPPPSQPAGPLSTPIIPPALAVSTILDGVYGVGAPPAWSADGQVLAFSAMPSDRSRGPDIYVWRVGDQRARPITTDHGSYFASWSGDVIVVSRATHASGGGLSAGAPVLQTIGIDVNTSKERTVNAEGLWLPQIDPPSRRAIAWHGTLAWDGKQVVPTHGALYLVDWAAIDPFAGSAPQPTPDDGDVNHAGLIDRANDATAATTGDETSHAADESPAPSPMSTRRPPRTAIATDAPTPQPLDKRFVPIEPARDVLQHPITDWRVMWSADGRVVGVWLGDIAGSVWGHLTVFSLDLQGRINRAAPVVDATLAKRGFNVGGNRVAWVAPLQDAPSGELRLRMWNDAGVRDVRIKPVESAGVVAAF